MAEVYAAEADRARVAGWRASVHTMRCALPAASVGVEYCGHARPIYFDSAQQVDATPAGVRRQVLEGNETWRALCDIERAERQLTAVSACGYQSARARRRC